MLSKDSDRLTDRPPVLPLTKLEPLPGTRPAGLLPLDRTGIPSHQARRPKLGPVLAIGLNESPGDGMPQGTRLAGLAAAVHMRPDIEGAKGVGGGEGLLDMLDQ